MYTITAFSVISSHNKAIMCLEPCGKDRKPWRCRLRQRTRCAGGDPRRKVGSEEHSPRPPRWSNQMRFMEKLNSVPGKPHSAKVKIKIKAERYRKLKFTRHKFCYVLFHLKTRTMKLLLKSWLFLPIFIACLIKKVW